MASVPVPHHDYRHGHRHERRCPSARAGDEADGSNQVSGHRVASRTGARPHVRLDSRRDHGRRSAHRGDSVESSAAGLCEAFGHSPRAKAHPLAVDDSRHRDFAYHADRHRRTRSRRPDCASDHRSPAVALSARRDGSVYSNHRDFAYHADRHRRTRSRRPDCASDHRSHAVALSARRDGPTDSNHRDFAYHADRQRTGDRAWPVREGHRVGPVTVRRRGRYPNDGRHLIDTVRSEGGHPHHDRNSGHDEVQMGKKASPQSTDHRPVMRKRLAAHGASVVVESDSRDFLRIRVFTQPRVSSAS